MASAAVEAVHSRVRDLAVSIGAPAALIPGLTMSAPKVGGVWIDQGKRGGGFSLLSAEQGGVLALVSAADADDFTAKVLGFITREMAHRDPAEQSRLMALLDPIWTERLSRAPRQRLEKYRLALR